MIRFIWIRVLQFYNSPRLGHILDMLIFVGLLCLLIGVLTGCTRTQYVDRPVEVKVRVPAECLEPGDIPAPMIYPVDQLRPGVSDGDLIGALLADREHCGAMEKVLRGVLAGCVGG
ncbi:hypothetical protein [Haliea salexigens]|uniref:hypothetical protein n=1 Tax=Haliea salexigens TaxID=287487 RepID=UPI0004297C82|nr:hypothetical protein [Haliea salexigens]